MVYHNPDLNSWSTKLVSRFGRKVHSDKAWTQEVIDKKNAKEEARLEKIRLKHAQKHGLQARKLQKKGQNNNHDDINELGERVYPGFSQAATLVERQSAKTKDHTDLLHGLSDDFDSYEVSRRNDLRAVVDGDEVILVSPRHEAMIASLPPQTWRRIGSYLNPCDAARLARTSKTLRRKMGLDAPFEILDRPENKNHKVTFLNDLDRKLPWHLLCFQCAKYHIRLNPGNETPKPDFFTNPVFICPNSTNSLNPLPRLRLTYGRELPYAFVQLPLRAARHGPAHGISPTTMSRRWKCKDSTWAHATRYIIADNHLLLRCISKTLAPPGYLLTETSARNLLFDREDYTPYFSVCAHWRDGELTAICKCMLSHVPAPPESVYQQIRQGSGAGVSRVKAQAHFLVRGCEFCVHARRCPECPTEYLVEVHMFEDERDGGRPVRHHLVVTRWSDLGDGSSPFTSPEWTAVKGAGDEGYDSFQEIGRRAVSGRFESAASGMIPAQRTLSLNPKKIRKGEDGDGWY